MPASCNASKDSGWERYVERATEMALWKASKLQGEKVQPLPEFFQGSKFCTVSRKPPAQGGHSMRLTCSEDNSYHELVSD